jgi:hypothetical protein
MLIIFIDDMFSERYEIQHDPPFCEADTSTGYTQCNPTSGARVKYTSAVNFGQTKELQKTIEPTTDVSHYKAKGQELTAEQLELQTLQIEIWPLNDIICDDRDRLRVPVAAGLDSRADATFISITLVNKLRYVVENLPAYEGCTFSSVLRGNVYPIAWIELRWHYLGNSDHDYEDEFLIIISWMLVGYQNH